MGGVGRSVHTFRRELFVKFRKSRHRTEKSLRHAQKPATPRSANPCGPESTSVTPGKDPPMATPPQGRKMAPERPFPILIETGKSYSKTGLLPAVFRRFSGGFPGGFPTVSRRFSGRFSGSFPAVFRRFCQRFDSGSTPVFRHFPAVLPVVSQRFCRRFSNSFPAVFPAFRQGFSGSFSAVSRQHASPGSNPTGSGVPLHPKETAGKSVHTLRRTNPT